MSTNLPKIFISHIHEEEEIAAGVQRLIEGNLKSHVEVFRSSDRWILHAGLPWLDRIRKELQEAKVVILMLSATSLNRPWVNFEAGASWISPDKLTIPVCFAGVSKGGLPLPYSILQALDLRDGQRDLVCAIAKYLGILAGPPSMIRTKFGGPSVTELLDRTGPTNKGDRKTRSHVPPA